MKVSRAVIHKTTSKFWEMFALLPEHIQEAAYKSFDLLEYNPSHPSLQFKKLIGNLYSARVTQNYRAAARKLDNVYHWFWIGPHAEYDKLIGKKN